MKELTPEEMKQVSGGLMTQGGGFFPAIIARLILGALFFDFGSDTPRLTVAPAN
jgi:bacteriocin-like protein